MFLGHFAAGMAAKRLSPTTPLPLLFIAAQFVDLLWPAFLLIGLEQVAIAPGMTAATPLDFISYPFTHSLLGTLGWGFLLGGGVSAFRKNEREAWIVAACVISHSSSGRTAWWSRAHRTSSTSRLFQVCSRPTAV